MTIFYITICIILLVFNNLLLIEIIKSIKKNAQKEVNSSIIDLMKHANNYNEQNKEKINLIR